jgi:hypothetical protein
VRTTSTRFKQYISRVIEERQMVHQRLMLNPKSAPSRKLQNGRMRYARKCGRTDKFFKQRQEQSDFIALPPLQVHKPLLTRRQIRQVAEERLRRFMGFLKQRLDNIKTIAVNNNTCFRLVTYDDGIFFRTTRCYGYMTKHGCMNCDTICACGDYKDPQQKYCSAYCKNVADNIC